MCVFSFLKALSECGAASELCDTEPVPQPLLASPHLFKLEISQSHSKACDECQQAHVASGNCIGPHSFRIWRLGLSQVLDLQEGGWAGPASPLPAPSAGPSPRDQAPPPTSWSSPAPGQVALPSWVSVGLPVKGAGAPCPGFLGAGKPRQRAESLGLDSRPLPVCGRWCWAR